MNLFTRLSISAAMLAFSFFATQAQDFSAYDRVSNSSFRTFLNRFEKQELPFATSRLHEDMPFHTAKNLSNAEKSLYLKTSGNYVFPKIFTYEADGIVQDIYGTFVPAYYFPTNGDYVLLSLFQSHGTGDFLYKTLLMSFDLEGNFISLIGPGYLDSGYENYVEVVINSDMSITHSFLEIARNRDDFRNCSPCVSESYTKTYQIHADGTSTEVSTVNHGEGNFTYGSSGYFFERLD